MKRWTTGLIGLFCGVGMALMVSCQEDLYYAEYKELSQCEWDSRDTLAFEIPVSESDKDVNVVVGVRSTSRVQYSDVVVSVQLLCDDHVVSSTPVNVRLYEGKKAEGDGLLVKCSYSRPQPLHIKAGHRYVLRLTHRMRLNPMEEIPAVGVMVEEGQM